MTEFNHVIIGTAGHIDHGKTALVKALTGKDADTLPEEKQRGLTIELGFVFMDIPGYDHQIVFIDVPGHERFVKTMAAGANSVDGAVLVIAADEGINVQTREHFDILQLLGIQKGFVALTKSDLVEDIRIEELKKEIRGFVYGSFLEGAPIIPVSSITGQGVDDIKSELMKLGNTVPPRKDSGIFRMPVDRVFTMRGFGTVIAGTVLSGNIKTGDEIEIYPDGMEVKVRGIQVHDKETESSSIGKRTALNLQDVKKELLHRGQCAGVPGTLFPSYRLDTKLYLLKSYGKKLKNRTKARLHIGTAEVIGRVVLLDREVLNPGERGFVQFVLDAPVVSLPRDFFVMRTFSPLITIGGGQILDPEPEKHKCLDKDTVEGLKRLDGELKDVVEQMVLKRKFKPSNITQLSVKIGERENDVKKSIQELLEKEILIQVSPEALASTLHRIPYEWLKEKVVAEMKAYLKKNPYNMYVPYADIRSQLLKLSDNQVFKTIVNELCNKGTIFRKEMNLGLKGYELKLKPGIQEDAVRVEQEFVKAGYASPLEEDVRNKFRMSQGDFRNIMRSLFEQGRLVRLSKKVVYHKEVLTEVENLVRDHCRKHQSITIAELRDMLKLSRKYAQAILEYFDQKGLTKRVDYKHFLNSV